MGLALQRRVDVTEPVRDAITAVPARVWVPALTCDGDVRPGAHITEITGLLTSARRVAASLPSAAFA